MSFDFGQSFEVANRNFRQLGGQFKVIGTTTIAFIPKGNTIEFSTAVCASHDVFDWAIGRAIALQHFINGQTVFIPSDITAFC